MFDGLKSSLPAPKTEAAPTVTVSAPEASRDAAIRHAVPDRAAKARAEAPMLVAVAFVGALSVLMMVSPPPMLSRPVAGGAVAEPIWLADSPDAAGANVLPVSQTFVVSLRPSGGQILQGTVRAAKRTVTGQAPMAGQVARVLVRPGRRVEVGDRVLDLSTGATSRAPVRAERQQSAAESEQVAAVARQKALEAKMEGARVRFVAAQQRVGAANRRLDEARDVLNTLRAGKTVAISKSPARTSRAELRRAARPGQNRKTSGKASRARNAAEENRRDALQEAIKAQRQVEELTVKASNAFFAASAADNAAQQKKTRVETAQEQLRQVEARFTAEQAKAAEVEAARGALSDAQSDANQAAAKATDARRAADALQTQRDEAKDKSRLAASRAAQALQKLQLFAASPNTSDEGAPDQSTLDGAGDDNPANDNSEDNNAAPGTLSLSDAAQMVSEAVAESDAAARQARRLKNDVDTYQRQVQSTQASLESSTQNLAQAQQSVMESTIRAGLSEVRAPASGVVLSIASIAQDVSPGEAVVTIGRPGRLEAVFSDSSDAWRSLKEGDMLSAVVDDGKADQAMGTPLSMRISEIEAPPDRSAPARLSGTIIDRGVADLRPGTRVLCNVAAPGSRRALMVPDDAIADNNGQDVVGVLQPAIGNKIATETNVYNSDSSAFRLEWRPVTLSKTLSKSSGSQREIVSGLRPGERIVMQASAWHRWSSLHDSNAVIRMAAG